MCPAGHTMQKAPADKPIWSHLSRHHPDASRWIGTLQQSLILHGDIYKLMKDVMKIGAKLTEACYYGTFFVWALERPLAGTP